MAEEMRFHLEQRAADLAADGLSESDARLAAQRRFGNTGSIQERAREAQGWGAWHRVLHDLRLAGRELVRSPGFSVLAIVTLALGIGANTAMFSVLNGILLKPLPYADVGQLDRFYRATSQSPEGHFAPADWLDFQRAKAGYGDVAAYGVGDVSLSEAGRPAEMAHAARSAVNFFSLLGVSVQLGRDFRAGEETPGRDRVVILSQRTWRNRFGSRPDAIGRTLRIDGEPHEIVGVLPETFNDWRYLGVIDLFRPLALDPEQAADRHGAALRIIGRRGANRPAGEAAGFVAAFGRRLAAEFPEVHGESSWRTVPLQVNAAGYGATSVVPLLIGLSGFVLLIACSNLANLLLARTMARAREFAVRAALGASRTQLLRPLIAESLLLAFVGGAGAVLLALWFRDWAAWRSTGDNGEQVFFALDWRVLGWAFAASLITAVAFGIAPALFALRLNLNDTLKSGGRGVTGGRGHQRFRQALVVGQFALAMILLAGAGLFVRGLHDLNHRRSGWASEHVVTGTILLPAAKYSDAGKIAAFHRLALERLAALPGAASVSLSSFAPIFLWPDVRRFVVEGRARPRPGHEPAAAVNRVSDQYFDTFGTRVLAGRGFSARDTATAPRVCLINQTAARSLFGDADPIGRRLASAAGPDSPMGEIVGVVGDVEAVVPDRNPAPFQIYLPLAQEPHRQGVIAVRASGVTPASLVAGIRATMADLDPDLPVRELQPADATVRRANYQLAVLRDILTAIALLGLALATLGIYGVIARTMAQRTTEFAIRLALGAAVGDLTRIVLASGVKLALAGAGLGLLGAYGVAQVLAFAFPGMRTNDVSVLLGATLMLIVVALVACWLPARRAGQVDATAVLRAE